MCDKHKEKCTSIWRRICFFFWDFKECFCLKMNQILCSCYSVWFLFCSVLNSAVLMGRAPASGRQRSLAYLLWEGPDCSPNCSRASGSTHRHEWNLTAPLQWQLSYRPKKKEWPFFFSIYPRLLVILIWGLIKILSFDYIFDLRQEVGVNRLIWLSCWPCCPSEEEQMLLSM